PAAAADARPVGPAQRSEAPLRNRGALPGNRPPRVGGAGPRLARTCARRRPDLQTHLRRPRAILRPHQASRPRRPMPGEGEVTRFALAPFAAPTVHFADSLN